MNIKIRFFLVIIISLIIALLIKYECPLSYCIFNFCIRREMIHLFVSLATVGSIFLAYTQWRHEMKFQKKSDINGLFEELRHNINTITETFVTFEKAKFLKYLDKILNELGDNKIYPNPTDSE